LKRRYVLIVENENEIEVTLSKKLSLLTISPEGQNIKTVEKKAVI